MIVDAILLLVQGVLNVLLAPLTIINIVVDFVAGIPVVFTLRIGIALVRLIKGFIPTMST